MAVPLLILKMPITTGFYHTFYRKSIFTRLYLFTSLFDLLAPLPPHPHERTPPLAYGPERFHIFAR